MGKIDSSTEILKDNEIENGSELLSHSADLIEGIKGFEDDTIKLEVAYKFNQFKKMYDDLPSTIENYDELIKALNAEKSILIKLKEDINHGDGKRNKYDEYLSFEEKKVKDLESTITLYVEHKNEIMTTYNELNNEIDQLLVERFRPDEVQ